MGCVRCILEEWHRYDTYRHDGLTGDLTSDFPPKRPTGNETADTTRERRQSQRDTSSDGRVQPLPVPCIKL